MYFETLTKAVDTAETFAAKTLTYVPDAGREYAKKFQEAYFSAARANTAAFSALMEKLQSTFAGK